MKITVRICAAFTMMILLCVGCSTNLPSPSAAARTNAPTAGAIAPSNSVEATVATETPMPAPSAMPTASASTPAASFNEENLLQYFQFGMSYDDVKNKLNELRMPIINEMVGENVQKDGWRISTDDLRFNFDSQGCLYLIEYSHFYASGWETSKGIKNGDSVDQVHLLYGKEDEFDALHNEYIYYRDGFLFSICMGDDNLVDGWKFFVNIWNKPFESGATPQLGEGNSAAFNEDNFMVNFPFGMGHEDVEKKLTDLGMRITSVIYDSPNDDGYWEIDTDHAAFTLDGDTDRLNLIEVTGWDTAKGLKAGDPPERLRQLYGKKCRSDKEVGYYSFHKKGYWFCVDFNQQIEGMSSWWVSAG